MANPKPLLLDALRLAPLVIPDPAARNAATLNASATRGVLAVGGPVQAHHDDHAVIRPASRIGPCPHDLRPEPTPAPPPKVYANLCAGEDPIGHYERPPVVRNPGVAGVEEGEPDPRGQRGGFGLAGLIWMANLLVALAVVMRAVRVWGWQFLYCAFAVVVITCIVVRAMNIGAGGAGGGR